ncbi:MAG: hypothetical protein ACKVOO_12645, partial [Burkholderiaceae bacterium]
MAKWTAFPHTGDYAFDAASTKKQWAKLHLNDAEPLPKDAALLSAWALFHSGQFEQAAQAGQKLGGDGLTVAHKATCMYATYLEKKEKTKLDLFMQVAQEAEARTQQEPGNANAWYWQAYALGRYSQGISVAKALAQGFGGKIKEALATTLKLQPKHADAHIAFGSYQAEVINKVGGIVAGLTYGAKKDSAIEHYETALKLFPESAITRIEYGNGLIMLFGKGRIADATKLYE